MSNEERAFEAGWGKWGQAGVPKRGWRCVGFKDLDEPSEICEMCERMPIRFVHEMEHDDYPDTLRVGCVCAGNMQQDLVAARRRDDEMKSRASKKRRWLTRNWKKSAKGNDTLVADGYRVAVYPKGGHYGATVSSTSGDYLRHSKRQYPTADAAKLAAFDVITDRLAAKHRRR